MESNYQVTMDTTFESSFNIHIKNHKIVKFLKYWPGMYYFDTTRYNQVPVNAYYFLSTIKYNKSYFSQNEIGGADRALDLQGKIGWPYVQD